MPSSVRKRPGYVPAPGQLSLEEQRILSVRNYQEWKKGNNLSLPVRIDWRNFNGNNFVTSIKNEGNCGACVAFGTTATMESRMRIVQNLPVNNDLSYMLEDLSPADLYYCGGRQCESGWDPISALSYAENEGVVPWSCFPYTGNGQTCSLDGFAKYQKTIVASTSYFYTIADMQAYLAANGPLITTFTAYANFEKYPGGVYNKISGAELGGHCMCVIGYDNDLQAWLCKNSWGTGWGESGYCWFAYGLCGIDAMMLSVDTFSKIYQLPGVTWQDSDEYDKGEVPSAALNSAYVAEVHKSQDKEDIWYRVGTAGAGFNGSKELDAGASPFIAINDNNIAVEVHKSQGDSGLWCHAGTIVNNESIQWGDIDNYDSGLFPSVAINNSGWVIEMHQSQHETKLYYKVGQLMSNMKIQWKDSIEFSPGIQPCVAMNNPGQIIEVHQSEDKIGLWYTIGMLNTDEGTVDWGSSYEYDKGYYPSVALNDLGQLVESHQSESTATLWYHTGLLFMDTCPPGSDTGAAWSTSFDFGPGYYTRVALNNRGQAVEVHQSQLELDIWYRNGTVTGGTSQTGKSFVGRSSRIGLIGK